jgi:diguanylate cyclase (GGDEF)-like protein/PAS domain S-box-containing protein
VLLLGLAGSGAAGYWVKLDIDAREHQQFVYYCEEIKLKIIARLKAHEQTLLSGAAVFDASETVNRHEWYAYTQRLRFNEHFNGIQGLGFAKWIPAAQLSAHTAAIRAEGFPDYNVHPEGEREAYSSIVFIEPFTGRNLRAFGYDMYSEPVRRQAMARARDENSVTLSGRVTLVQETDNNPQAGTLMYVPVYEKNKPLDTVEQRRAALFGWVYSPFRMNDLLNNIVLSTEDIKVSSVNLKVYEGRNTQTEHLLYDNNPNYQAANSIPQHSTVEITSHFNGTVWTLQFEHIIDVNALDYSGAWITLSTGVLISILLFLLLKSYLTTRIKAASIADQLTKQLQESENRFRVLVDNAPVLIWMADVNKLCFQVNKVWLAFTGRTLEQELGNGWMAGVHADDLQHCMRFFKNSFDARLPFTIEYRLRRYDGEYRWLLDNGVPLFTDDGTFLGYIGSCIDITERKQAEKKVQKSLSLLHATLESSSDAILVVDTHNTWVLHNQKFVDLWQIPDEITASNDDNAALTYVLSQLTDPDGFLKKVQELYHHPETSSFDILNFKEGKIIERYSIPQRINGNVVGRVWSFRDITERATAEYYLRRESEKNIALLRNASDGIHILDTDGNVIEVSDSFCKMLGYQREEVLAMNVTDWDVFFSADECIRVVRRQFEKPVRALFESRHRRKDGTIIDVEVSGFPLELDGKPALFNSSRNITERKRVENALHESQTLLQTAQRAARLGHYVADLNNMPMELTWTNDLLFDDIFGIDKYFVRNLENWVQVIHPDDRARVIESFGQFIKTYDSESLDSISYRIIRPVDGVERWIEAWAYNFYNEQNNPVRQVGMIQDITERKRIEEVLRERENYQRALLDNFPFLVWLKDEKSRFLAVNQPFVEASGYSSTSQLLGKTDFEIWSQELAETYQTDDRYVLDSGMPKNVEEIIEIKGKRIWFETYKSPITIDGKTLGTVGFARDITERKQIELEKRASEEQLRAFYELDLVGLTITSPEKGWILVNDCLCKMLEYPEASLRQMKWTELTHPDDLAADIELFEKMLANEINGYSLEKRIVSRTGKIIPVRLVVRCVRKANGEVDYVTAMVEDISDYKKAEAELRIAATVFESQEGMLITDKNQVILNVNQAFTKITGYSADDVIGQTPRILQSGRHDKAFYAALWQSINDTGLWQGEIWNRRKNGEVYPEWQTITAVKGDNDIVTHYVSTLTDITERKATEEYINRLAFYDPLTQLPNRRLLQERLKHGIELYHRTGSLMAVLMMDLDKFKAVNDKLGHAAGDELLQQVAERIKYRLREVDMVARLGGDEFVILLDDVGEYNHVAQVATSIIETLSQPFALYQSHTVYIGASIGIAIYPQHGDSIEVLMDNADTALYRAKEQGRGCFVYFSE